MEGLVHLDLRVSGVQRARQVREDLPEGKVNLALLARPDRRVRKVPPDNRDCKEAAVAQDQRVRPVHRVKLAVLDLTDRWAVEEHRVLKVRWDPPETVARRVHLARRASLDK